MRLVRLMTAVAVAWTVAVGVMAVPSAQAPMSEEDFDKLMKGVGAASGAVRKALRKRHSQDNLDFFATDPNTEIRTLGRLALRPSSSLKGQRRPEPARQTP